MRISHIAILVALFLWPAAVFGQSPELMDAYDRSKELSAEGRYQEAIPFAKEALRLSEREFGPDDPTTGITLNNLAGLYDDQGRYAEAEPLYKRAMAIWEKALGPDHPDVATGLNNLAMLYKTQGRYGEAEPLLKSSLAIDEKALGPDHPDVAIGLHNLATLYEAQGRYAEVELLYKRALVIWEKALGPGHPNVATSLNNLAGLYQIQGRYAEAEPLHKRALEIREKVLSHDHPDVAGSLNNLAELYRVQGRYSEAEPLYKRVLAIDEKALGPDHPSFATSLHNLALLYDDQGRYAEAVPHFKRSLEIWVKVLGPDHPDVALGLNNLAWLYHDQDRLPEALAHIRQATTIHRSRAKAGAGKSASGALSEQKKGRPSFAFHVDVAFKVAAEDPPQESALHGEAFEVSQLARATAAASAVAQLGARFAAGEDRLAQLVREHQDTLGLWQSLDAALIEEVSKPPNERNAEVEKRLRTELTAADKSLTELDRVLAAEFPQYAELANPQPAALSEVQQLLGPTEALLAYLVDYDASYLWVVRSDAAEMHKIEISSEELADKVTGLRRALDPTGVIGLDDIRQYDVALAHELYTLIFAPAEPLLEGVTHIMAVTDGPLQSLPLSILVTEQPEGAVLNYEDYREVSWLAKSYALTTLPSVSSLRALRLFAKDSETADPFAGFGDPVLDGAAGDTRGITLASLFSRGPIAAVDEVRKLTPLPDTAGELPEIADSLGADASSIYLREDATETRVKSLDLSATRVIAFATHGLLAGDLKGVAEPALVLTPPEQGTERDDGLLTASEVAQLKLGAEWVILSACNTAAPDGTPGAEGLSGLAKAFLYAGGRALLVSHWPVVSAAATEITTRLFEETAGTAVIGRAEALRRSMLALMNTSDKPYYAHPLFWAPFVVVGEGARQ